MSRFGATPDHDRRRLVEQMHAEGLTYAAIAKRLGVTKQAAQRIGTRRLPHGDGKARCQTCKAVLCPDVYADKTNRGVLCLACLGRQKDPSFQDRLKAFRVAAGLSRAELARLVGIKRSVIDNCELGICPDPRLSIAKSLTAVLGVGLLRLDGLSHASIFAALHEHKSEAPAESPKKRGRRKGK